MSTVENINETTLVENDGSIPIERDDLVILRVIKPEYETNLVRRNEIMKQIQKLTAQLTATEGAILSNQRIFSDLQQRMIDYYNLDGNYDIDLDRGLFIKVKEDSPQ